MSVHRAWDDGSVTDMFANVLKPKTRKTACGKVRPFAQSGTGRVDCQDCDHESAVITNGARDAVIGASADPDSVVAKLWRVTGQGLEPRDLREAIDMSRKS